MALAAALPGQTVRLGGSFRPSVTCAGAWDTAADGVAGEGDLRLGPLLLGSDFGVRVGGDLGDPGVSLYWMDSRDGSRRALQAETTPRADWVYYRWGVPKSWQGHSVYLVASDQSKTGWLGVSAPIAGAPWEPTLMLAGLQVASFVIVLLPGVAWILWRGGGIEEVLLASAVAAYAAFWAYVASSVLGKGVSVGLLIAGVTAVALGLRGRTRRGRLRPLLPMLGFALGLGLFYVGALVLYGGAEAPLRIPEGRFQLGMPPDTEIPYLLSDVWYRHLPLRPFLGDWLTSDRPPLQAGFCLLAGPILPRKPASECVGIVAQVWIFLAFWGLLDAVGATGRERKIGLLFTVLSGFVLFNVTFVWPKLLPAALLLLLFGRLQREPGRGPIRAGLLAALAMLAHGGSAFALFALALWHLWRRLPGGVAFAGRSLAVFAAAIVPWTLYQKLIDPPGDRLLKWHLGGVEAVDARPLGRVLLDAYRSQTVRTWLEGRWANVSHLFFSPGWHSVSKIWQGILLALGGEHVQGWMSAGTELRVFQMFIFFPSFGVLLLGLGPLLWTRAPSPALRWARTLAGMVALTVIVWCVLLYEPGSTVNHLGTYFTNGGLLLALGIALAHCPRWLIAVAGLLQVALFVGGWILVSPHAYLTTALLPSFQGPAAVLMVAGAGVALAILLTSQNEGGHPSAG